MVKHLRWNEIEYQLLIFPHYFCNPLIWKSFLVCLQSCSNCKFNFHFEAHSFCAFASLPSHPVRVAGKCSHHQRGSFGLTGEQAIGGGVILFSFLLNSKVKHCLYRMGTNKRKQAKSSMGNFCNYRCNCNLIISILSPKSFVATLWFIVLFLTETIVTPQNGYGR